VIPPSGYDRIAEAFRHAHGCLNDKLLSDEEAVNYVLSRVQERDREWQEHLAEVTNLDSRDAEVIAARSKFRRLKGDLLSWAITSEERTEMERTIEAGGHRTEDLVKVLKHARRLLDEMERMRGVLARYTDDPPPPTKSPWFDAPTIPRVRVRLRADGAMIVRVETHKGGVSQVIGRLTWAAYAGNHRDLLRQVVTDLWSNVTDNL